MKTDWRLRACRDADPDLFFDDGENAVALAVAVCTPCPIRQNCLDWALSKPERHGVWGGTTHEVRKLLGYRKLRKRCPRCGSREVDTSLDWAQTCSRCGVSWRT